MAAFRGARNTAEAQGLIQIRGKNGAFLRSGYHGRSQEEPLVQGGHQAQIRAHLLSQSGGGESESTAADAPSCAADVAADRSKAAAGIFNQASHGHIRTHIRGLHGFHKLTVAVVHHHQHIRLYALAEGDQLPNLLYGKGGPCGVALGALNGNELRLFVDGFPDGGVVKTAVGQKIHLPVGNAILCQGAGAFPYADYLLEGVIWHSNRGEKLVSRQQIGTEGHRQGMGAAGDLRPDQGRFRMKYIGVHPLQVVPAQVIVAVAGSGREAGRTDPVFLHGVDHLRLVVFRYLVNGGKTILQAFQHLFAPGVHGRGDAHFLIQHF